MASPAAEAGGVGAPAVGVARLAPTRRSPNPRREPGRDQEQHRLGPRTRCRRRSPGDRTSWRARSAATVPEKPPRPKAMACAAPHRPMRTPSRASRPVPGQRHHRADGRHREGAVGDAQAEHRRPQRPGRADEARGRPGRPASPPRRGSRRSSRRAASRRRPRPKLPASATSDHAEQHAAMLHAGRAWSIRRA